MTIEDHPEHLECLALVPVGTSVDPDRAVQVRLGPRHPGARQQPGAFDGVVHMRDDREPFGRIVHPGQPVEELIAEIIPEEREQFDPVTGRHVDGALAEGFGDLRPFTEPLRERRGGRRGHASSPWARDHTYRSLSFSSAIFSCSFMIP